MTMENINERWKILSLEEIEERYKENFTWVKNVEERTDTLTKINMAYDQSVKRLVIAKSTCYREKDINAPSKLSAKSSLLVIQNARLFNITPNAFIILAPIIEKSKHSNIDLG